jgi:hypothetical protein
MVSPSNFRQGLVAAIGLLCCLDLGAGEPLHWSFRPVQSADVPAVRDASWPRTPVDRFVLARLEDQHLEPAPEADRRTLVRRIYFDLIGLPPSGEEVEAFASDSAPDAYERLVDRLLASPHYGERWGRHWLDVARYADTAGNAPDFPVPQAYRYRDWVIRAFNANLPFDRFLREQIAGDLTWTANGPLGPLAALVPLPRSLPSVATGFLALHRRFDLLGGGGTDHQEIEDIVEALGRSILGLGLSCARCHDHKFDPISQADYYGLYGFFQSTRYPFPGCEGKTTPTDVMPGLYAVAEGDAKDARIHRGGDPGRAGPAIGRRFPTILGGQSLPASVTGSGRLHLARWLTDPRNPLTARVMVNRIWQHHFGAGLVRTPNDFGTRGTAPTHPELLDYLANRFVDSGWSVKEMHRLIVRSRTYRQASRGGGPSVDPDNRLLGRFPRRRLDAEAIRDALLAVGGKLDRSPGGPHPFPPADQWKGYTQHNPFTATYETDRRSVYLMQPRLRRHPFLALFDGPDPNASTGRRQLTTTPIQALFALNDSFVHAAADGLAERMLRAGTKDSDRLRAGFLLAYARPPAADEVEACRAYLRTYAEGLAAKGVPEGDRQRLAWASVARVLLASNEFVYVD